MSLQSHTGATWTQSQSPLRREGLQASSLESQQRALGQSDLWTWTPCEEECLPAWCSIWKCHAWRVQRSLRCSFHECQEASQTRGAESCSTMAWARHPSHTLWTRPKTHSQHQRLPYCKYARTQCTYSVWTHLLPARTQETLVFSSSSQFQERHLCWVSLGTSQGPHRNARRILCQNLTEATATPVEALLSALESTKGTFQLIRSQSSFEDPQCTFPLQRDLSLLLTSHRALSSPCLMWDLTQTCHHHLLQMSLTLIFPRKLAAAHFLSQSWHHWVRSGSSSSPCLGGHWWEERGGATGTFQVLSLEALQGWSCQWADLQRTQVQGWAFYTSSLSSSESNHHH